MIINHNLQAMNTHRQLGIANTSGAKSMEKLSSGYRINRAGDDAAGLAISEKMRGQIRGLNQASRNAQDGISLIQTAEGALNETHAILQRMRELAVQSSTDTNTEDDRKEIQKEINQLTSEINRIGNTTEFNTMKLVDGSRSSTYETKAADTTPGKTVEVTKAVDQTITIGKEPVTWDNDSSADFEVKISGTADNGFDWSNLDATGDNKIIIQRSGDNFTVSFDGKDGANTLKIDADAVVFDAATSTYAYKNQGIEFSFKADDIENWADGDSFTLDLNTIGTNAVADHSSVAQKVDLAVTGTTGDATYTMTDITITEAGALQNVDKIDVEWDETAKTFTATMYNGADKVSETTFSLDVGETLNYNENGISFEFKATAGDTTANANIKGSFDIKTETKSVTTEPEVITPAETEDRSLAFQVGANQNQSMSLEIGDMRAAALGISSSEAKDGFESAESVTDGTNNKPAEYALNVTSREDAAAAITTIQTAINTVSSQRSALGAVQNRLEHTIKNLDTSAENLQASEARIRDVDMAKEMMEQTKQNILQQASTAMLAQANQAPQNVLQLLR